MLEAIFLIVWGAFGFAIGIVNASHPGWSHIVPITVGIIAVCGGILIGASLIAKNVVGEVVKKLTSPTADPPTGS